MAEYFDGNSATAHEVLIRFEPDAIVIHSGSIESVWRSKDIRYASSSDSDKPPVTFRNINPQQSNARLVIDDQSVLTAIRKRCPNLTRGEPENRETRSNIFLVTASVAAFLILMAMLLHFLPGTVAALFPVSWEEKLGDQVVKDIAGLPGLGGSGTGKQCASPDGSAALNKLSERLLAQTKSPYRFRIIVIDIDMVNAFAAPGGRVVFFRKLLTDAKSPEEAAGVLAHEIAHSIKQHPMQSVSRSMGISLIAEFMLGGFGGGIAGSAGQVLLGSAYSREAEREADQVGLEILRKAKISPRGFFDFFDRLAREQGENEKAFALISSHPPSKERAEAAKIPDPVGTTPALSPAEWKALQNICG